MRQLIKLDLMWETFRYFFSHLKISTIEHLYIKCFGNLCVVIQRKRNSDLKQN